MCDGVGLGGGDLPVKSRADMKSQTAVIPHLQPSCSKTTNSHSHKPHKTEKQWAQVSAPTKKSSRNHPLATASLLGKEIIGWELKTSSEDLISPGIPASPSPYTLLPLPLETVGKYLQRIHSSDFVDD